MSQINADQRLADFQAIPVIDISGLLHGDAAARQAVADTLGHAAREVGFFQWWVTGLITHFARV